MNNKKIFSGWLVVVVLMDRKHPTTTTDATETIKMAGKDLLLLVCCWLVVAVVVFCYATERWLSLGRSVHHIHHRGTDHDDGNRRTVDRRQDRHQLQRRERTLQKSRYRSTQRMPWFKSLETGEAVRGQILEMVTTENGKRRGALISLENVTELENQREQAG